ncbi:Gldg family protein [Rosistilla oblonga]|uniref:Gldg family protein n=1 Tax=Rosistilla oblonga TaxID=2527990 RepID=UPI003A976775
MDLVTLLLALIKLLLIDLIFVGVLFVLISLLARTKRAAFAVLRRNFFGYFSNPTGYVFLCIFVFLTSLAAFWPYEFFNDNLATLDQLNRYLPLIMLFFIPAITMSIWAEEKRQGTDELLLTLPADDFDIVMGKYLAASAIFTASLIFSQLSNFITLAVLSYGDLDTGLFFTTYLGYWFVGLTMIAIGMVASFLTGNLTVGFILGALFNAPLAFASMADVIIPAGWFQRIVSGSGLSAQFDDFGRGVISLSSTVYFVLVAVIGIYLCMVLIGRRHWAGSKDGNTMFWHYAARALALMVLAGGAVVLIRNWDQRVDTTEGNVSSLAPATIELIKNLDADRPIVVDAFISTDIPEQYARTRYELVSVLKEFRAEAAKRGKTIDVNLYQDLELFSDEAALASERFGIEPVARFVRSQGSMENQEILLGAAFRSGLEKVVVPFFDYGIPVEYELVRSIKTVSQSSRKRLGIVNTDANMMGGFSMAGGQPRRLEKHPLVVELEKQYQVDEVDLSSPLDPERFDAVVAVQPSSLAPDQFDRLVEGVKAGIPMAIFEDPMTIRGIPGTGEPKQSPGGMFGQQGGPIPKGDIRKLWDVLEIESPGMPGMTALFSPDIVWQQYNPYPKMAALGLDDQWLFAKEEAPGAEDALSEANPITAGLREILFIYAGAITAKKDSVLKHTPLVQTGMATGLIPLAKLQPAMRDPNTLRAEQGDFKGIQTIAMAIEGPASAEAKTEDSAADDASGDDAAKDETAGGESSERPIKAVYVADTDLMIQEFLAIRAQPELFAEVDLRVQNVTFVLNVVDWLADESLFIDVRKHEPRFSTLQWIEEVENEAREKESAAGAEFDLAFKEKVREIEEKNTEELQKLQKELDDAKKNNQDGKIDLGAFQAIQTRFMMKQQQLERMLTVSREKLERERDSQIQKERRAADLTVRARQNRVKAAAVTLPCIPPLLIGVIVFASRRLRERENIAKSRLR